MARRPKKSETENAAVSDGDVSTQLDTSVDAVTDVDVELSGSDEKGSEEVRIEPSHCGGALRLAREQQGQTVQDVAKQLRLGVKQIDALEQDCFSDLPEATIVKGFIRNYAKLLKIPSEPLLSAYTGMMPEKEQYAFVLNPGINMKITESKSTNLTRYFILALMLLLGAGVWFFYQHYVQKPNPVNPTAEIVEALPELALPMSERLQDESLTPLQMPPVQAVTEGVADAAGDNPAVVKAEKTEGQKQVVEESDVAEKEAVEDVAEVKEESVVEVSPEPTPGKTRLEFSATQETWLSVVNASGKEVYNKILYAGNHDVVDIWQPAEIVVGNSHGATLVVDGKPIDLAPYTRINVARVRLNR